MAELAHRNSSKLVPEDVIKDPYMFTFLGLNDREISESDEKTLENRLIEHLQDFLLELGEGFCFEARQKRGNKEPNTEGKAHQKLPSTG